MRNKYMEISTRYKDRANFKESKITQNLMLLCDNIF